ncbi:unnamed protein product, partial [Staurois parvus]
SLCALPGSVRTPIAVWDLCVCGPDHVITDSPISDYMNSSKQDVTSDIVAYYV